MCLLVLAWQAHPRYRLVVAANRDEFHERPAAPLAQWPAPDSILAGRDLRAQGTWLGLDPRRPSGDRAASDDRAVSEGIPSGEGTPSGGQRRPSGQRGNPQWGGNPQRGRRFGVITNFRDLQRPQPDAPSRGALIPDYLRSDLSAASFLDGLEPRASRYSGFNLLLTDADSLWYASNRAEPFARPLPPGVYGLSNEFLDTPWPKLRRVRQRFDSWLADPANGTAASLFDLLNDRVRAGTDEPLPQTGIPLEWERVLSAPFVLHPDYGTRASTVLLLERSGAGYLVERSFDADGNLVGQSEFALATG